MSKPANPYATKSDASEPPKNAKKLLKKLNLPMGLALPSQARVVLPLLSGPPRLEILPGSMFARTSDSAPPQLKPFELKSIILGLLLPFSTLSSDSSKSSELVNDIYDSLTKKRDHVSQTLISHKYLHPYNAGFLTSLTLIVQTNSSHTLQLEPSNSYTTVDFIMKGAIDELNVTRDDCRIWTDCDEKRKKQPPPGPVVIKKKRSREEDDPDDANDYVDRSVRATCDRTVSEPVTTVSLSYPALKHLIHDDETLKAAGYPFTANDGDQRTSYMSREVTIPEAEFKPPLPTKGNWIRATKLTRRPKAYVLDCEMCSSAALEPGADSFTMLGRISLLELTSLSPCATVTVLDSYVACDGVGDWKTEFSGLTVDRCTASDADKSLNREGMGLMTYKAVQEMLLTILSSEDILMGHALSNDLITLKLLHANVVDTALLYRDTVTKRIHGLKYLCKGVMNKWIQQGEHDSVEDCVAAAGLLAEYVSENIRMVDGKLMRGTGVPLCDVIQHFGVHGCVVGSGGGIPPGNWDVVGSNKIPKPKADGSVRFVKVNTAETDVSSLVDTSSTGVTIIMSNPRLEAVTVLEGQKRAAVNPLSISVWSDVHETMLEEAKRESRKWNVKFVTRKRA
jgi:hypothetical protein